MLPITEVFISIQGEGYKVGLPTIFVRVAGCNFVLDKENGSHPCTYCDSDYAWNPPEDKITYMEPEEVKEQLKMICMKTQIKEICLTGGEPLCFPDAVKQLITRWYNISIETNGSLPIWKSQECAWSMDMKCPSSGNSEYNNYDNLKELLETDQVKFVIGNREDFDFAREIVLSMPVFTNIIFQPVWKKLKLSKLIKWTLQDKNLHSVRIGTQLQKHAWPRKKRRV